MDSSDATKPDKRAIGALGGEQKAANQRMRLARVVTELPPMDSLEAAKARLEIISTLAVSGALAGSQAGAAVRAVEVWVKTYQAELDRNRLRDLERQIETLEKQLAATRTGVRRVG